MNTKLQQSFPYDPNVAESIDTGTNDRFKYSPVFDAAQYQTLSNFQMTGTRRMDRQNSGATNGIHCHHVYDYDYNGACTVQNVPAKLHIATYPHRGAVYQWNQHNPNNKYRAILGDNKIEQYRICCEYHYTQDDIEKFEKNIARVHLPQILKDIYINRREIEAIYTTVNQQDIVEVEYVMPLFAKDINSLGADFIWGKIPFKSTTFDNGSNKKASYMKNYFCCAEDGCGNFLFLDISAPDEYYFYDHENDLMQRVYPL